ncbi:MAG TPA: hypothetical protein VHR66_30530 [Gemmataceae bacterium]|jgi:hypothetical protein|nr:hypothetical protein [Gemmataceae bacterium]
MRSRCLLLAAVLAVSACQKKQETVLELPTEYGKHDPASRSGTVIDQPATGKIAGKNFTPDNVVFAGRSLSFRKGKDFIPEMEIRFDVPAGKLEGKEWKFEGDKFENPIISFASGKFENGIIWQKDYTLTLKITKESSTAVEGSIDLHAKGDTHLQGRFTATRQKTGSDPLEADDAPYVHGQVAVTGPWTKENFAVGFVATGVGSKQLPNMVGTNVSHDSASGATTTTFAPQLTSIASDDKGLLTYRHTRLLPGEYLVYAKRNQVLAAWQKVTLKAGDQLKVDLTIDPSKTGEVVVTLPEAEANDSNQWPLSLSPVGLDVPGGTGFRGMFNAAEVKTGQKEVKVAGVPAGKYTVTRGKSRGEVEIVVGKSTAVTLVRDEPTKK